MCLFFFLFFFFFIPYCPCPLDTITARCDQEMNVACTESCFLFQIVKALEHLHSKLQVIHRGERRQQLALPFSPSLTCNPALKSTWMSRVSCFVHILPHCHSFLYLFLYIYIFSFRLVFFSGGVNLLFLFFSRSIFTPSTHYLQLTCSSIWFNKHFLLFLSNGLYFLYRVV